MSDLATLAAAYGIATEYADWRDRPVTVSEATLVAVLAALGVDASTPDAIRAALAAKEAEPWLRVLPPFVVMRRGSAADVPVHAPSAWIELADGGRLELSLRDDGEQRDGVRRLHAELPGDLPIGWHTLHAPGASSPLAVAPASIAPATARGWGFMAQLYSIRSRRSWGFGDLADLAELAAWSGRDLGAGFVLVNPLHSGPVVPPLENSPYLPSSRRFAEPLYLRIEDIPEATGSFAGPAWDAGELIDREAVWAEKRAALAEIFAAGRSAEREADFRAFVAREGEPLRLYATWIALAARHGQRWQDWPAELRDPSKATAPAEEVDFYCWLQWLLDSQLAGVQRRALDAGMPIGVVHDLAVGVSGEGADAWALQDVLASGVTVGAPPDAFNQQGQNWAQPPWNPAALAAAGYAPFRDLLRALLRHAGGIRVDHVLGLFRLWWVPDGASPIEGTYVRYDADALLGILALEAHRAGALVIGEDLGTVAPGVPETLASAGILGSSVLWFEVDDAGVPLPPTAWRRLALASLTTHDLPTTVATLTGEHIALRHELGLLTESVAAERARDTRNRQAIGDQLARYGLRPDGEQATVEALHRYLTLTPSLLIGVHLPDAVGDRRPQNLPGTSDEYPNWCVPLTDSDGRPVLLDDLPANSRLLSLVKVFGDLAGDTDDGCREGDADL